jgi:hypothetical protein
MCVRSPLFSFNDPTPPTPPIPQEPTPEMGYLVDMKDVYLANMTWGPSQGVTGRS